MSNNLILNKEYEALIIEDEPILALALESKLKDMGLAVCSIAINPENAITYARNKQPDIAIVDVNLNSEKNGIDVAKYIWKNFNIPIIFLTSYCNDKLLNEAMECEPYAYLIKPCKNQELKAIINTTLHKHQYFFKNKDKIAPEDEDYLYIEDNIKLNRTLCELYVNETLIPLTKNEKKLFELLSQNPGKIMGFDMIFNFIWREDVCDLSKLRSLIYRIKNKVGVNVFENIYEEGYRLKVFEKLV